MDTPGPTPVKNQMGQLASISLGLGDQLTIALNNQMEEKKRRNDAQSAGLNRSMMGPAALSLLGGSTFGTGFFNG